MARSRKKQIRLGTMTAGGNRRRRRQTFSEALRHASARAHERTNRRLGQRDLKHVRAAIAGSAVVYEDAPTGLMTRMLRWLLGMLLLPFCWVTSWTFFSQFSDATLDHGFWKMPAFWYFATGVLLMTGWFFSGLLRSVFLYLYVLGHELTHILFIWVFRGRVSDWGVSLDGGYVTTDKSNIVIALSPYFVPLWAAAGVLFHAMLGLFVELPPVSDKILFGWVGFFWAFHLLWTLWMIPRDQPDLKENGRFLSLVIIYLANQLLLAALLCAVAQPLGFGEFATVWATNAARFFQGTLQVLRELQS
ncbi:MAG: hypothetical protein EAZ65_03975 [Verrucomicrobia bacterium]|nr:MAG: hypothetical protein EAZ84_02650 [Verrucomicrobiota bacterium]TAE88527.1 MAG: hypothetical protein EAZ82_04655 [Verrucomicrobiota bacterium]TAF26982.1 MAG: hypothetical protein EAZ71_03970 [Verrucomicrobiota bacterium]TAF42238.1 MAG: hypothetical protein EAZ65_03975 [Verrucomicrobiota bacterium]